MRPNLNAVLKAAHDKVRKEYEAKVSDPYLLSQMGKNLVIPKPLKCADGFSVSVQASSSHYCTPRQGHGPWTEVELGFPSEHCTDLDEWQDGEHPTETVYGYVPVEVVEALIEKHGGLA